MVGRSRPPASLPLFQGSRDNLVLLGNQVVPLNNARCDERIHCPLLFDPSVDLHNSRALLVFLDTESG